MSTVGLALTKRNRQDQTVLRQFREEIGDVLNRAGFFDTAPFQRVDVVLRLGTKEQEQPQNLGIDKELGWLELAIETEVEIRNWKIQPADNVKRRYLPPVCRAIRYAGEKYGLPIDGLDEYEARILAGDPDQC